MQMLQSLKKRLRKAPQDISSAQYCCPSCNNDVPLLFNSDKYLCSTCKRAYPILENGICQLDIVLNEQRIAFDKQYEKVDILSKEQIKISKNFFNMLSDGVILESCKQQNILDMACGKGEITLGMAMSKKIEDCCIYAFDHSLESLRILQQTIQKQRTGNTVFVSAQDVNQMAFPHNSFKYVFGNAILHHFENYEQILKVVYQLLQDGGKAVFAEPFLHGYALFAGILRSVDQESFMSDIRANSQAELGLFDYIVNDIATRANRHDDKTFLKTLTDKHLYTEQMIYDAVTPIGFSVQLSNTSEDRYYEGFMDDLLNTYQITHPQVRNRAKEMYDAFYHLFPESFGRIFSHQKRIILTK